MVVTLILSVALAGINPGDPVVVIENDGSTVEVVQSTAQALLDDARQRKALGEAGFGDHYRRAAWAAYDDTAAEPTASVAILEELLEEPESIFDVFDAYRMLGQMYSLKRNWALSELNYEQAYATAVANPVLVDSHPSIFNSIMQGYSVSRMQQGNYQGAFEIDVALRDHPATRIAYSHKKTAARSAARNARRTGDIDNLTEAWNAIDQRFSDTFSGRDGVYVLLARAKSFAQIEGNLVMRLEAAWDHPSAHAYDSGLVLCIELANAWDASDIPENTQFAFDVLTQGWQNIAEHETDWKQNFQNDSAKLSQLKSHTKIILRSIIDHSMELENWEDVASFAQTYINRYGNEDHRGGVWLRMAQKQLEAID